MTVIHHIRLLLLGGFVTLASVLCEAKAGPAATPPAEPPAQGYIYKDGLPQGDLFLPMHGVNAAMRFAAEELQQHLEAITGKRMVMSHRAIGGSEAGIVLAVRPAEEWKGKASAQCYTIIQDPRMCRVRITGNTGVAVLYGVYQYLGDLGVRWFAPGELGTNMPRMADIPILPGERSWSPSFASRTFALSSTVQNNFGDANGDDAFYDYQLYLMRNRSQLGRFAATHGSFRFNLYGSGSGHAIKPMAGLTAIKVRDGLMAEAPERFALVTDDNYVQARRYDGGQICFTNETNIKTAVRNCIAHFEELELTKADRGDDLDEDYTVPMGLSDCRGICECTNCAKIAGDGPYSNDRLVWWFWNQVARGLRQQMPGRIMAVYAPYMDLTMPPGDVTIEPNIMSVTPLVNCWEKAEENKESYPFPKSFLEQVTQIRQAGAMLGCYSYLNYPYTPTPLLILDGAKGYADLGYKHYHMEAMQRSEYAWPIIWSLAQFTWDARKAPREYLREYCLQYYGTTAGPQMLEIFEEMTQNALTLERITYGGAADTSYMFPDTMIGKTRNVFRNVIQQAQGKQQQRLRLLADAMEAQFQLAETYRAYCHALNTRAIADIQTCQKRARGLVTFWRQRNLKAISNTYRTPEVAAELILETDFDNLKPAACETLAGMGPTDARWMKELFAGTDVPEHVPNLFALPEVWKLHLDALNTGSAETFSRVDYDDSGEWQPISTLDFISSQGYGRQIGGYFWYRLLLRAPAFPADRKVFLRIGSLDDTGDVYLNGVKVGSQLSPRDWDKSFVMDVTAQIKNDADNILVVHGYDSGGGEGVWRPCALYTD